MAKKKIKLKSIFKIKFTNTQTIISVSILLFIFAGLGLFLLSNNTVLQYRELVYSRLNQAKNNYDDYLQSLTPTPLPKPTPIAITPMPTSTNLTEQLPNINFELLRVYQTGNPPGATAENVKVITNSSTINKIYNDIKNLPIMLPGTYNCPAEFANSLSYSLNFYSNDTLTISFLVQTSGCRIVEISPRYKTRMALGSNGAKLFEDLQQL